MKKRDRAAVLIFCVVLMAAVGTIILSSADLGRMVYTRQAQVERDAKYELALDGLVAVYSRRIGMNDVIVPTTEAFEIGGQNYDVSLTPGVGARNRFIDLRVDIDVPGFRKGRTYPLGSRGPISPTWFALGSMSDFNPSASVAVNGDAYFSSNYVSDGNECEIQGSLFAQLDALTEEPDVSGEKNMGSPGITPVLDSTRYNTAATLRTTGNQTSSLLIFLPLGPFRPFGTTPATLLSTSHTQGEALASSTGM